MPPGVELRYVGSVAQLHFSSPEVQRAYLEIVGKTAPHQKSDYYLENWVETLGPVWNTIIEVLRYLAVTQTDPRPTVPDLARACGVSSQTIRRHIAWWEAPEWMQKPPSEWPKREYQRWLGVRGYLPSIWAPTTNAPYQFKVLRGDVIHPKQRPEFARLLGILQPELAFDTLPGDTPPGETAEAATPDPEAAPEPAAASDCPSILVGQIAPPPCPPILEGQESCTSTLPLQNGGTSGPAERADRVVPPGCPTILEGQDSRPPILEGQGGGAAPPGAAPEPAPEPPFPPAPPYPRACMQQHAANNPDYEGETPAAPSAAPDPAAAAAALLAQKGEIPWPVARRLIRLSPTAPQRAEHWAEIYPATKRGMAAKGRPILSDYAFLAPHMRGECACLEPRCDVTEEYVQEQSRRAKLRTAAPAPERARTPVTPVEIDPQLRPYWDTLLACAKQHAPGTLADCRPTELHSLVLIVTTPNRTLHEVLGRKQTVFNAALREKHAGFCHQVEFVLSAAGKGRL